MLEEVLFEKFSKFTVGSNSQIPFSYRDGKLVRWEMEYMRITFLKNLLHAKMYALYINLGYEVQTNSISARKIFSKYGLPTTQVRCQNGFLSYQICRDDCQ